MNHFFNVDETCSNVTQRRTLLRHNSTMHQLSPKLSLTNPNPNPTIGPDYFVEQRVSPPPRPQLKHNPYPGTPLGLHLHSHAQHTWGTTRNDPSSKTNSEVSTQHANSSAVYRQRIKQQNFTALLPYLFQDTL